MNLVYIICTLLLVLFITIYVCYKLVSKRNKQIKKLEKELITIKNEKHELELDNYDYKIYRYRYNNILRELKERDKKELENVNRSN